MEVRKNVAWMDNPHSCFCPVLSLLPFNGHNRVKWRPHLHHWPLFVSMSTDCSAVSAPLVFSSLPLQKSMNSCTLVLKIHKETLKCFIFDFNCEGTGPPLDKACLCTLKKYVEHWLGGWSSLIYIYVHFDRFYMCEDLIMLQRDSWKPIYSGHSMHRMLTHQCLAHCLQAPAKQ